VLRNMPAPRRGEIIRQIREALFAKVCARHFPFAPVALTHRSANNLAP
jgi:hypothetical protein